MAISDGAPSMHAKQGKRKYDDIKLKLNQSSISIYVPVPHNWNVSSFRMFWDRSSGKT